jgi:uncharacterized tellurite resistance protein B-like protein
MKEHPMTDIFDWTAVPDDQRGAFYGVLLAMAHADGTIDAAELALIDGLLAIEGLSEATRTMIPAYMTTPSVVEDGFAVLSLAPPECRFAVMLSLMDVALANGVLDRQEKRALVQARCRLGIRRDQLDAMEQFVRDVKRIQPPGGDEGLAAQALKHEAARLKAAGIPLAAVAVSGRVIGVYTRGMWSGLAAVGATLEKLPNFQVMVGLGTWTASRVRWLQETGQQLWDAGCQWLDCATPDPSGPLAERRAQLVMQRLQAVINEITSQVDRLKAVANRAEDDHQKMQELLTRLRMLQQQIEARQRAAGGAS